VPPRQSPLRAETVAEKMVHQIPVKFTE